ncbi:hypothetical protein CUZ95_0546 [Enterococcus lactis]|nr:hypothetical protein [Enterococcus lactis]
MNAGLNTSLKSGNMSRMLGTFAIFDHPFNRVFFYLSLFT